MSGMQPKSPAQTEFLLSSAIGHAEQPGVLPEGVVEPIQHLLRNVIYYRSELAGSWIEAAGELAEEILSIDPSNLYPVVGGAGTATPADPQPNDAVHQEALRIIRAAWHALPPAVGSEIVKDGATLAGCIRAIPVGDPPLVSAALAVLDEIDRTGHVGEGDPTVGRLRDALSRPTPTKSAEENP